MPPVQGRQVASNSSSRSISLSPSKSSRNELSRILENIHFSKTSRKSSRATSSSGDPDAKRQQRVLAMIEHYTLKACNNIVLHVKFLSSPLRLYLKVLLASMPPEQKVAHLQAIKISDRVKENLASEWSVEDSFGLKVLMKMYRLHKDVMPMVGSHEQFLRHFKPLYDKNATDAPFLRFTAFYLFNHTMNPGVVQHPNGVFAMEHNMHSWFDGFLEEEREEIEEVGFERDDLLKDLVLKLAFELNTYASVVFKKPITFKHYTGHGNQLTTVTLQPEELVKEIFQKFAGMEVTRALADQMMYWSTTDEAPQGTRIVSGGRHKKSKK